MHYKDVAIPMGAAWSSPFTKWQGTLGQTSSIDFAADVTRRALQQRGIEAAQMDGMVLGWTVPQKDIFYGAPTLAGKIGAEKLTGPMVSQACATSVACVHVAASSVSAGARPQLVVATDRTSNGPELIFPRPNSQGGAPQTTNWVMDSFARDPWAESGMLKTAELVASELNVSRAELDDVAVQRWHQYETALANDREFQRRYMVPVEISARREDTIVEADEGVRPVIAEDIKAMQAASADGLHTFATQTHPADGCAGAVVTNVDNARELSNANGIVRLMSAGFARVGKSRMPEAPVPAAMAAMKSASVSIEDIDVVATHNPFAVNDVYFARHTGYPVDKMNPRGCSMIFGHPQGPTGLRSISELVEELRLRGGGTGLFTGCAAGDTGAAIVLRVED